jgi:hypothetical protein
MQAQSENCLALCWLHFSDDNKTLPNHRYGVKNIFLFFFTVFADLRSASLFALVGAPKIGEKMHVARRPEIAW